MKLPDRNQELSLSKGLARGFTLIEVLVVMAIIFTMAGIGFGVFFKSLQSAKENETRLILDAVSSAMVARSVDISSTQRAETALGITTGFVYPDANNEDSSTEKLIFYISGDFNGDGNVDVGVKSKDSKIVKEGAGQDSYVKLIGSKWVVVDSWDKPIHYKFPGVYHNEDDGFDLRSAGPDGIFDNEDDIILK